MSGSILPPVDKKENSVKNGGVHISSAKASDIEWLMDDLREFDKFYDSKKSLFGDEGYVRSALLDAMEKHLFLVARKDGVGPIGFISGLIHPHIYNPDIIVLAEMFWWVKPEYRHSRAATLLMDSFIEYGKKNADWVIMTIENQSPVGDRPFLKRGFVVKEKTYLMEIA